MPATSRPMLPLVSTGVQIPLVAFWCHPENGCPGPSGCLFSGRSGIYGVPRAPGTCRQTPRGSLVDGQVKVMTTARCDSALRLRPVSNGEPETAQECSDQPSHQEAIVGGCSHCVPACKKYGLRVATPGTFPSTCWKCGFEGRGLESFLNPEASDNQQARLIAPINAHHSATVSPGVPFVSILVLIKIVGCLSESPVSGMLQLLGLNCIPLYKAAMRPPRFAVLWIRYAERSPGNLLTR